MPLMVEHSKVSQKEYFLIEAKFKNKRNIKKFKYFKYLNSSQLHSLASGAFVVTDSFEIFIWELLFLVLQQG